MVRAQCSSQVSRISFGKFFEELSDFEVALAWHGLGAMLALQVHFDGKGTDLGSLNHTLRTLSVIE